MTSSYESALQNAIEKLVSDFQGNPIRRWRNERDFHWSLFYHLKRQPGAPERYPTDYIRAEFPTLKTFGERPARGHYDLVILDPISLAQPAARDAPVEEPWDVYLQKVKLLVAVEIKVWLSNRNPEDRDEMINWDVQKLTDLPNMVQAPYFLSFVELSGPAYERFYPGLREKLSEIKAKHPKLNVLCVPSQTSLQPKRDNWL